MMILYLSCGYTALAFVTACILAAWLAQAGVEDSSAAGVIIGMGGLFWPVAVLCGLLSGFTFLAVCVGKKMAGKA